MPRIETIHQTWINKETAAKLLKECDLSLARDPDPKVIQHLIKQMLGIKFIAGDATLITADVGSKCYLINGRQMLEAVLQVPAMPGAPQYLVRHERYSASNLKDLLGPMEWQILLKQKKKEKL